MIIIYYNKLINLKIMKSIEFIIKILIKFYYYNMILIILVNNI